ncbi:MAG: hypothetical protein P8169_12680, partial [Chloroflexota bacterium]
MTITRRTLSAGALGLTVTTLLAGRGQATESKISDELLQRSDFWTALEAYAYAYPLVTMEYTRRVMTNVAEPTGTKAPMGQIGRLREY